MFELWYRFVMTSIFTNSNRVRKQKITIGHNKVNLKGMNNDLESKKYSFTKNNETCWCRLKRPSISFFLENHRLWFNEEIYPAFLHSLNWVVFNFRKRIVEIQLNGASSTSVNLKKKNFWASWKKSWFLMIHTQIENWCNVM